MTFPNREKKIFSDLPENVQNEFQKAFKSHPASIEVLTLVEAGRSELVWEKLSRHDKLSPWLIYRKQV